MWYLYYIYIYIYIYITFNRGFTKPFTIKAHVESTQPSTGRCEHIIHIYLKHNEERAAVCEPPKKQEEENLSTEDTETVSSVMMINDLFSESVNAFSFFCEFSVIAGGLFLSLCCITHFLCFTLFPLRSKGENIFVLNNSSTSSSLAGDKLQLKDFAPAKMFLLPLNRKRGMFWRVKVTSDVFRSC